MRQVVCGETLRCTAIKQEKGSLLSETADIASSWQLRELLTANVSHTTMSKTKMVFSAVACAAVVGVALAQVQASSTVYLIDVDPARYAGPVGQRVMLRLGDQPRNVTIGTQDEICVQLQRVEGTEVISARVRALRPEPKTAAEIPLVGPNIAPGTYRSTPWGLLLRAMPGNPDAQALVKVFGTDNAPVCTL